MEEPGGREGREMGGCRNRTPVSAKREHILSPTPASLKHMGECDENGATKPRKNVWEGCLKGLIWLYLIIAKEMKSKFGKAVMVIKDVIRSFMSPYLMKRRKHDKNDFSKQNELHRVSPLYWLPKKNSQSVSRGSHLISEVV